MKEKPWTIQLIAILLYLTPLIGFYFLSHMPKNWEQFLYESISYLLMASCLLSFRQTGHLIFLILESGILVFNIQLFWDFHHVFTNTQTLTSVTFLLIHLLVLSYFLVPSVRKVYENANLRWWVPKIRFKINLPCNYLKLDDFFNVLQSSNKKAEEIIVPSQIENISETGLFLKTQGEFKKGEKVSLSFSLFNLNFNLRAEVVQINNQSKGIGVKFISLDRATKKEIKRLIYALELLRAESTMEFLTQSESFKNWFKSVVTTGKGIFPEV